MPAPKDPEKKKLWHENMSKASKGKKKKPFTQEHKDNMSKTQKGRKCKPFTQKHRDNMSKARLGKHYKKKKKRLNIKITRLKCKDCGYKWIPRKEESFIGQKRICPICASIKITRYFTQKYKDTLSKVHTGVGFSQDHKDAMRKGMKNRSQEEKKLCQERINKTKKANKEIRKRRLQKLKRRKKGG